MQYLAGISHTGKGGNESEEALHRQLAMSALAQSRHVLLGSREVMRLHCRQASLG
eukprot:CAMPEP_0171128182 /NCGR_PEP_ID=MMETSP0766_2-20121228/116608_1 /TAXON_ID=439317 /ORGANISM="Gambierdiscus australes, Strain CAWD 149" /LENGTH=54 /DNA_ID=CAMNT_0011591331 /DNA_START=26 /DNA_END=186 /DNA_ORIENTATION=-